MSVILEQRSKRDAVIGDISALDISRRALLIGVPRGATVTFGESSRLGTESILGMSDSSIEGHRTMVVRHGGDIPSQTPGEDSTIGMSKLGMLSLTVSIASSGVGIMGTGISKPGSVKDFTVRCDVLSSSNMRGESGTMHGIDGVPSNMSGENIRAGGGKYSITLSSKSMASSGVAHGATGDPISESSGEDKVTSSSLTEARVQTDVLGVRGTVRAASYTSAKEIERNRGGIDPLVELESLVVAESETRFPDRLEKYLKHVDDISLV